MVSPSSFAAGHPPGKLTVLSFTALTLERVLALVLTAVVAAVFGATSQSSTYFLALIVPITLGLAMSEALYTALLPPFTSPMRPTRALLRAALRGAAPLAFAASGAYIVVVLALSPAHSSVWLAFSPLLAAMALNGVYAAFLTADRRYAVAIMRVPLATAIALASVGVVLPFWRSPTALALAVSLGQVLTLATLAVYARGAPRDRAGSGRDVSSSELIWSAMAVFTATLVGGQLVIVVERFLASALAAGAVALLAFARGIALLPVMFAQALGSGIFPAAAERFKALERDSLARLVVTGVRLSILAGLVSTVFVVVCRRELIQVAFQRDAFGPSDTRDTATLVGIIAASLAGVSAGAVGAKALFALGRRSLVLGISAIGVVLYVLAAFLLRHFYGLEGLAAAFAVASTVTGLLFVCTLVAVLDLGRAQVLREWALAPAFLASAFAVGALAVGLPLGGLHPTFAAALGTAVAVGVGGLATLAITIIAVHGQEYSLLSRVSSHLRSGSRRDAPVRL